MWINQNKTRIFFDMHLPDWPDKKVATNFDPEHLAEVFSNSGSESVILYAKCQYGNFYYNTEIGHKHSGLGGLDLFRELQDRLRKKGIKVIAYYSVSWDEHISERYQEWQTRGSNGEADNEEYRWKTLCINSPYREVVLAHVGEIARKLSPDGLWIDMSIIGKDRCHCKWCSEKFRDKYNTELPQNKNDSGYNTFMQWRYDYIEEFYEELYSTVRAINPDISITNNYWGYPYSSAWMGSRAIGALRQADFVTGEGYTDWTGLNAPSFFSKFLRGAAGDRPFETLIGRFCNTWDYTFKPFEQLAFEAYTIAANNGTVTIDDEPYYDGSIDPVLYENIKCIFDEIKNRRAYTGGELLKYAAILHSQQTKDYFNDYGDSGFIRNIAGSFKLLKDLHYPIDFIFDESFDYADLSSYKAIIMPSVAVISEKMAAELKEYADNGGLLILSGMTGLYSIENGTVMKNNFLNSYFGIEVQDLSEYSLSYIKFKESRFGKGINIKRPSLVKGKYLKYVDSENYEVIGTVTNPICDTTENTFFHNNLPSPHEETGMPAVFVKKQGKGSVAVFAQEIFAQYAAQHQLEIKNIVRNIVQEFAEGCLVEYACPNKIDVSVNLTQDKLNIHLINPSQGIGVSCGYMDPFDNVYPRTFEYIDEIIPVYDVVITVNSDKVIKAESIGESKIKSFIKADGKTRIHLDRIYLWETISLTLGQEFSNSL